VREAIRAERGMVRIQAQTIRRANPQRTAERRDVDRRPLMAPAMVWVVLTGMPPMAAPMMEMGRRRLGAEPADGP